MKFTSHQAALLRDGLYPPTRTFACSKPRSWPNKFTNVDWQVLKYRFVVVHCSIILSE